MEIVSIQAKHYWTCLWPGMSELWWRGRLSALPSAIAFAVVVNSLLIAKFIYPGWISGALVMLACWILFAAWVVLTIRSIRELPLLLTPRQVSEQPDRFAEAQAAYLTGNYAQAEEALTAGLSIEPRDPPALLMLAAVLRHTGRLNAAEVLLNEIPKLDSAKAWMLEWESERARLERDLDEREAGQDDEAELETADQAEQAAESLPVEPSTESTVEPANQESSEPAVERSEIEPTASDQAFQELAEPDRKNDWSDHRDAA
ncbi:tetratricopeptide repeat protein [Rhodopirellula halodulae]|uniref:tetratricopeptide repeat protein n=1 Tax=Rhodopirellula halodulae TaxID=2894198 RepID=UPI001E627996|nr:tetratricopeptide repeat protein [Rhodopirellula sp. JC737]MCC9658586.1 tetratricopeptide repeat protein [Rhodopirellula sp. JC737]